MALSCPFCGSDEFFAVEIASNYFTVDAIRKDGIDLGELVDSFPQQTGSFKCQGCGKVMNQQEYLEKKNETIQNDDSNMVRPGNGKPPSV